MKLGDILKAGYTVLYFDRQKIKSVRVNENYGIVELFIDNGTRQALGLDMDHKSIPIEFALIVEFDEEIADSLLLAGVAPVSHDSVVRDFNETTDKREQHSKMNRASSRMADAWGIQEAMHNSIYERKFTHGQAAASLLTKNMFKPEDLAMLSTPVISNDHVDAMAIALRSLNNKKEDK